jgi:hypothetical protein
MDYLGIQDYQAVQVLDEAKGRIGDALFNSQRLLPARSYPLAPTQTQASRISIPSGTQHNNTFPSRPIQFHNPFPPSPMQYNNPFPPPPMQFNNPVTTSQAQNSHPLSHQQGKLSYTATRQRQFHNGAVFTPLYVINETTVVPTAPGGSTTTVLGIVYFEHEARHYTNKRMEEAKIRCPGLVVEHTSGFAVEGFKVEFHLIWSPCT